MEPKYVQDELPLFGETFLVGDQVMLVRFIEDDIEDELDDIEAARYIGRVGKVIRFHPDMNAEYRFEVEFEDGMSWLYKYEELERV